MDNAEAQVDAVFETMDEIVADIDVYTDANTTDSEHAIARGRERLLAAIREERKQMGQLLLNILLVAEMSGDTTSNQEVRRKTAIECQKACLALQGIPLEEMQGKGDVK